MSAQDFNELFVDPNFKRVLRDVADETIEKCGLQRSEAFDAVAWAVGNEQVLFPIYCAWQADRPETWLMIKAMLRRQVLRYLGDPSPVKLGGAPTWALAPAAGAAVSPGEPADHGDQRVDARAERSDEAGAHRGQHGPVGGTGLAGGGARFEEREVPGVGAEREVGEIAHDRHETDQ
jgi:hypothetical protein